MLIRLPLVGINCLTANMPLTKTEDAILSATFASRSFGYAENGYSYFFLFHFFSILSISFSFSLSINLSTSLSLSYTSPSLSLSLSPNVTLANCSWSTRRCHVPYNNSYKISLPALLANEGLLHAVKQLSEAPCETNNNLIVWFLELSELTC